MKKEYLELQVERFKHLFNREVDIDIDIEGLGGAVVSYCDFKEASMEAFRDIPTSYRYDYSPEDMRITLKAGNKEVSLSRPLFKGGKNPLRCTEQMLYAHAVREVHLAFQRIYIETEVRQVPIAAGTNGNVLVASETILPMVTEGQKSSIIDEPEMPHGWDTLEKGEREASMKHRERLMDLFLIRFPGLKSLAEPLGLQVDAFILVLRGHLMRRLNNDAERMEAIQELIKLGSTITPSTYNKILKKKD